MENTSLYEESLVIKENIKAYQEACNTLRHYSNSSYNVRVLVIVQGIVLVGAWVINYDNQSKGLLIFISSLGILLTFLLFLFHHGYFYATRQFYDMASVMEEKLFDKEFRPFQTYNDRHAEKYYSFFTKVFVLFAPFTLTFILFVTILILSISK
jgi:hypothetical protein